jgi:hypothetical protein
MARPFTGNFPEPLRRSPDALVEVSGVRHSEMQSIHDSIDRLDEVPKSRKWRTAAGWLVTTALGAVPGFVLLVSSSENAKDEYASWIIPTYGVGLVLLVVGAIVCFLACRDMDAERTHSLADCKRQLKALMDSFVWEPHPRAEGEADEQEAVP